MDLKIINSYVDSLNREYKLGNAREHSYRPALKSLLEAIDSNIVATNEPARIKCGAPDYIITRNEIPIGYIEAKDIDVDLQKTAKSEQLKRYLASLDRLILTDYLRFKFFKNEEEIVEIQIAKIEKGGIKPIKANFEQLHRLIQVFLGYQGATITSSNKLAKMMSDKAKMMASILAKALENDEKEQNHDSTLLAQLEAFKEILIHGIKAPEFADIYAQTISYGMFAARLHDNTPKTFSRQEASELIPKSNPFLRKLFGYIAGFDLDDRIKWIVDSLADLFSYCDVKDILKDYGKSSNMQDPIIHFYETFLSQYDPKLRKSRGVWYTPLSVVNFIVRAVDNLLKSEFDLSQGLADSSKIKINLEKEGAGKQKEEIHKVQILDPATGTGTFLAEVISHIYHEYFNGQQGLWNSYVNDHLIDRLHGFELLMTSYAMAHLKMDLLLKNTGYKRENDKRFGIYLTNSLEDAHKHTGTLFSNFLTQEAKEANFIKKKMPVMVVLGNPPYSVSSSNKGEWIQNLIADYKKDLNERKINLDDDYIKFLRYSEHFIAKNGKGIVAMITNNSFIDGITHRQMRKHMLETFDQIYIVDLHGNSRKKEVCPDGSKDENVFDIMQGVSINIFVKTSNSKKVAEVFHHELWGKRNAKYEELFAGNLANIKWKNLPQKAPYYFFVPKDFTGKREYEKGFGVEELFVVYSSGVESQNDRICIQANKDNITNIVKDFIALPEDEIKDKYNITKEGRNWKVATAKGSITDNWQEKITQISYRPFDIKWTYLNKYSNGFLARPKSIVMKHMIAGNNLGVMLPRICKGGSFQHGLVTRFIVDRQCGDAFSGAGNYLFPLYLYPDSSDRNLSNDYKRRANFNFGIVKQLSQALKLEFEEEKSGDGGKFAPIDVLDYIYGILHAPSYREKYKEFLKINFPRVPYPQNAEKFFAIGKIGSKIREFHLLEHPSINKLITKYPEVGDSIVEKITYDETNKRVYLNKTQYFEGVEKEVYEFYIGGYQVLNKWLKDRKNRALSFDDIMHYQKIVVALSNTIRLMNEVNQLVK